MVPHDPKLLALAGPGGHLAQVLQRTDYLGDGPFWVTDALVIALYDRGTDRGDVSNTSKRLTAG
jgi:hypothetical protein